MKLFMKLFGNENHEQEIKLLSDQPTEIDSIGGTHEAVADTLRDIICSDLAKPFVIGLFGSWGSGKSSVLKMLKLKSEGQFRLVIVDAWRKDKDNFLRQFVKSLARSLLPKTEAEQVVKEISSRKTDQTHNWHPDKIATAVFWCFIAIIAGLAIFMTYRWLDDKTFPAGAFAQLAFAILAAVFFQWILPRHEIRTTSSWQEITLDDPAWFREIYFNKILRMAQTPLVCIAVDNLDRVPAEDAMKIIRTIKTFIVEGSDDGPWQANDVVFLVPCDDEALSARFAHESAVEDGREFLRKFFNVGLRIPMLQSQDSVSYVRDLLTCAGLTFSHDLLDRVAFVIATAVGQTPRKPKYLINYYLSRLHLCYSLQTARHVVEEHPDWFAVFVVLESEFSAVDLPTSTEALRAACHAGSSHSSEERKRMHAFLAAVQPIAKDIQPEAWYIFLYMRNPRVHELIPGFRELYEAAIALDFNQFSTRLAAIFKDHREVITYLWDERKDASSRMNVAAVLIQSLGQNIFSELPARVANDVCSLVEEMTPGWDGLSADIVYEKVFKNRRSSLARLMSKAAGDGKPTASNSFVSSLAQLAMADGRQFNDVTNAVIKVLSSYAASDQQLVIAALNYRPHTSRAVFIAAISLWQNSQPGLNVKRLLDYGRGLFTATQENGHELGQLIRALLASKQTNPPRPWDETDCEGYRALIDDLSSNAYPLQRPEDFMTLLDQQIAGFETTRKDKGSYFVLAALIKLTAPNELGIRPDIVLQLMDRFVPEFLTIGHEDSVVEALRNHVEFIEQHFDQFIDRAGCRSEKLCDTVIRSFPRRRRAFIHIAVSTAETVFAAWSKNYTNALDEKTRLEVFNHLLAEATKETTSPYEIVTNMGMKKEPLALSALEKHFSNVLQMFSPLSTLNNLLEVARRMEIVGYSPTVQQKDIFRKGLAEIEQSTMTPDQKALVRKLIK